MEKKEPAPIKAIIGLGNPGPRFHRHRHNIGFRVLDELAARYHARWQEKDQAQIAEIIINGYPIVLVKPQTFMNTSGKVVPMLSKRGIKAAHIMVVHDELEKPFGAIQIREGGSARGHNGLRSLIEAMGPDFRRLRFGIGRPDQKEQVPDYVLSNFDEPESDIMHYIFEAIDHIEKLYT